MIRNGQLRKFVGPKGECTERDRGRIEDEKLDKVPSQLIHQGNICLGKILVESKIW